MQFQPFALVGSTGAAIVFGDLVAEAGGVADATFIAPLHRDCDWSLFLMSGFCGGSASFFACRYMGGGSALMVNVLLISIICLPFAHSPPLHPALCLVQFLVLQAKHSSSFSQNPSRQGPSWLARHFCNNYPSALDLVLALALVALVLGVIYRGSIVLRLFNWSFDFWFACY